jgi:cytochrome c biogenesis protein CcdA/thiol-disulfide isomerase/thioredoxin
MEITLFISSFLAGMLTVLAPCVLPLLPVIIGSSVSGTQRFKPVRITLALAFSLTLFTLLLKATTLFINIPPEVLAGISGGIIIFFGLISIFPNIWDKISIRLGLSSKSDKLLENAGEKGGFWGDILIGMSLGPVFASCSPTYAVILATVLPVNFWAGLVYMIMYALGLALVLLLVSILGRKFINKVKFLANPNGIFKKIIGVIFIIVGVMLITGADKQFQVFVAEKIGFDITKIDQKLLPTRQNNNSKTQVLSGDNSMILDPENLLNANYPAPELTGLQNWINSDPQTIQGLKGKVVLIDFWTYSCINCLRTLPYLTKLDETYKDKGLVILGLHAPEFAFEKLLPNVQKAVKDNNIQYPVAQDNDFKTWKKYENQFWPAKYLIDKDGNVRYTHFGEGDYDKTEK